MSNHERWCSGNHTDGPCKPDNEDIRERGIYEFTAEELQLMTVEFEATMQRMFPDTEFDAPVKEEFWQMFAAGYMMGRKIARMKLP